MKLFINILGGGIRVINRDRIPEDLDSYVVVCTHRTWMDVIALGVAMKPTPLHYMAKKELFGTKLTHWLFQSLHAFPVDRASPGPSSLKIPQRLLKEGKVVGIFPGGTRSSENSGLKRGAYVIAKRAGVPIVPAVYQGPITLKNLFKRQKIYVNFGEPIDLGEYSSKDSERVLQNIQEAFFALDKELD
ncbi:1-acyl-sn-glycerol-3-phosphate acyltransferase [Gracilibacillus dipsosauri]|uniref:1-acyl-sn-glycerol-3-phosphate acyltransferase n=2 Tax=Gracilibacillus dipsosauri TaxID=178340 RepID=A0A317L8J2_9BACI|nr:1-acyl-sn-glycerol-3-phosphate acyltransferase [Gracilibacillus dipsosauri]